MIVVALVAVLLWDFVYAFFAVDLTPGQQFKYYFDYNVVSDNQRNLYEKVVYRKTFSYDVIEIDYEGVVESLDVLPTRFALHEGDAIFTELSRTEDAMYDKGTCRANELIDRFSIYSMDELLKDAKTYLYSFVKDELQTDGGEQTEVMFDTNSLSSEKIENTFLSRMSRDNRYRTAEQKAEGIVLETERIYNLAREVKKFQYLLELDDTRADDDKLFYTYRKYEQTYLTMENEVLKEDYRKAYEKQSVKRYGLRIDKLENGQERTKDYFGLGLDGYENKGALDIVLLAVNFLSVQPHLQFETISFINCIVELFSDLYSGI